MYPTLLDLAIFGYIAATGLSLAYLVQREEWLHRLASVATIAGWVLHAVALLALAFRLARPPLGSLSEAMSVAVGSRCCGHSGWSGSTASRSWARSSCPSSSCSASTRRRHGRSASRGSSVP